MLWSIATTYSRVSKPESLRLRYDMLTIRAIDIQNLLGFTNAVNISKQALEYCFGLIAKYEPEEIISNLLKTEKNFYVLINCCFENYIEKIIRSKYKLLGVLSSERQDLLLEKIKSQILNDYKHFLNYDRSLSQFKTYLYRNISFSTYGVLREEGLTFNYFGLSVRDFQKFISAHSGDVINPLRLSLQEDVYFHTRSEVISWFQSIIKKEKFEDVKNTIWEFVQRKTGFQIPYDRDPESIEDYQSEALVQEMPILRDEIHKFIRVFKRIEKRSIYRLVLKLQMGLDLNYINDELPEIIGKEEINLNLLNEVHSLIEAVQNEKKGQKLRSIIEFFSKYSEEINKAAFPSIQQRIHRSTNKLSKIFDEEELLKILRHLHEDFDFSLFEYPPTYVYVKSLKFSNLLDSIFTQSNLRVISINNYGLNHLPPEIENLKELKEFDLRFNYLNRLPVELENLTKLKILDLRNQFDCTTDTKLSVESAESQGIICLKDRRKIKELLPNTTLLFN